MLVADSQPVVVQFLTGTAGSAPKREGGREGERDKDSKMFFITIFAAAGSKGDFK